MGVRYRKSRSSGPFRVTVSKSGLHTSVGGKGFRVGVGTNGKVRTTVSIPGTGISYTTTRGGSKSHTSSSAASSRTYTASSSTYQPQSSSANTSMYGKSWIKAIFFFILVLLTIKPLINHPAIFSVLELYFVFKTVVYLPIDLSKSIGKKPKSEPEPIKREIVKTENGWICPDCETENSNASPICKGCGKYK